MFYAAIDIHKHEFQAAVLDADSGEVVEERFSDGDRRNSPVSIIEIPHLVSVGLA